MNVELINPFLKATLNVLETMAQTTATPGKPIAKPNGKSWGVVNGVIGMAGDRMNANFVISFDQASILAIVSRMLMEEITELNSDVVDAVGEITNMIVGAAKVDLGEMGYNFEMSIPIMLVGTDLELSQQSGLVAIQVPFTTPEGRFVFEATTREVSR